jgi:predicted small lipoprotein YifL
MRGSRLKAALPALLILPGLLGGCGQKGPLYLPEKRPTAVTAPPPATTPAPDAAPAAAPGTPGAEGQAPPKKPDSDKNDDSQAPQ